jgi:hypothetical protein
MRKDGEAGTENRGFEPNPGTAIRLDKKGTVPARWTFSTTVRKPRRMEEE